MAVAVAVHTSTDPSRRGRAGSLACHHPRPEEMEPYERVLTDAMAGDPTLFARQDYVEEASRIVDPVLNASIPVTVYEPHTLGPSRRLRELQQPGGRRDSGG
jgi:glucose-6-phosphate 1-dehydrogenase